MSDPAWTTAADVREEAAGRTHGSDINLRSAPQLAEYEAAADRIARAGHRRVLDWGCGFGQMTRLLRDRGVQVSSIDYDPGVDAVTTRPLPAFEQLEMLATSETVRLPYADDSFDAVLSMGVLEHVQDPEASLDELHRVLVPGGLVYCYKLPNRRSYLEAIARRSGRMYYHGQLEHDRLYTVASARAIFEGHGFDVLDVRRMNLLPLTVPGRATQAAAPAIWSVNRALSRVPGLNALATNVQIVARAR
jgi:2-polyprenyl-3-methyl-5-hydroxy-6-metoxy-1,4-benzoquinol methylase